MINPKRHSTDIRKRDLLKECWTLFCMVVWTGFSLVGTFRAFTDGIIGHGMTDLVISWIFVGATITIICVVVSECRDIIALTRTRRAERKSNA